MENLHLSKVFPIHKYLISCTSSLVIPFLFFQYLVQNISAPIWLFFIFLWPLVYRFKWYNMQLPDAILSPILKNEKKNYTFSKKKLFYVLGKWNSYISRNGTFKPNLKKIKDVRHKKFLIFREMELSSFKIKKCFIFLEIEFSSLIFFLYFRE